MIAVTPGQWLLLSGAEDFPETSRYHWNPICQAYMFKTEQQLRWPLRKTAAKSRQSLKKNGPTIMDSYGQSGRLSADGRRIEYNAGKGFFSLQDAQLNPVAAPFGHYSSLNIGGDTLLSAAYTDDAAEHGISLFHLNHRWKTDLSVAEPIIASTIDAENNLWLASETRITLCQGEPLHFPFEKPAAAKDHFIPQQENPHKLRQIWSQSIPPGWRIAAIYHDEQFLYLLANSSDTNQKQQQIILTRERSIIAGLLFSGYRLNEALPYVTDMVIKDKDSLLLMSLMNETDLSQFSNNSNNNAYIDCPAIKLQDKDNNEQLEPFLSGSVQSISISYPMLSPQSPRFIHRPDNKIYYQSIDGSRELSPRIQARYPSHGRVSIQRKLDSGSSNTIWHRVYLDAKIPPGSQIILYAGTYNVNKTAIKYHRQADLIWNPLESELPFTKNPAGHEPDRSGLFEVLLQTNSGNIRHLQGRYLALRIVMTCDGKQSPLIYNIRIYHPRFCYQQAYLPAHFQQQEETDLQQSIANGADVRERMLASFEAMLSPIEARIANIDILLDSHSSSTDFLPFLSQMLGKTLAPQWPEARQRRYISNLGKLQRWNGTLRGLQLILDIISDGAVVRGEIIIVENFRLRRTMATLLGLELDDSESSGQDEHPLTLGTGQSGNSIIGSSLILSDKNAREFLALLDPQLANESDAVALELFFEQYSHQTSILLHGKSRQQEAFIAEILKEYMPAHLQWNIYQSDYPFILGLSPLLEINTFIESQPAPRRVRLDDTYLGYEGLLINPAALSPDDVNVLND